MSQFSPTVVPTWGEAFAHALGGSVQSYLNARRQKQEDEMTMYGHGLQPVETGSPAPTPLAEPPVSGPELAGALSDGSPPPLGRQTADKAQPHPALIAQALSSHVQSGQSLRSPSAPIHLMGRDWRQTDASLANQQLATSLKQSELGMNAAHTDLYRAEADAHRTPPHPNWSVQSTDNGLVRVNPQTGAVEPLTMGGAPVAGPSKPQDHVVDPVTGRITFFDPAHPPANLRVNPAPHDSFTFPTALDENGKPVVYRANTKTGSIAPTGIGAKGPSQGATQQQQQARVMAAMSEARLADERMRKYEDKLLSGDSSIGPLKQAAGTLMSNLSGTHSVLGALGQAGSEASLNETDPDYAQYLRDAMTIGRAEQMISPRGGNETMVRANSLLARAGTGAAKGTIDASRMARQALFGPAGGIEQTLTPEQSGKLKTGVERIKAAEQPGGSIPGGKPPLADRVRELRAHGLTKEAARVQLLHEGYDLHGGTE